MISLQHLTKVYGNGTTAVRQLSLEVEAGEVCMLLGPSGCGKTTVLKMINRLIEPTSGSIALDGEDVTSTNPVELRRRIGYVIQQVGLFPHMTVADNVATVPRLLGWGKSRTSERVDELLHLVGLDPETHRRRYPHQLSGGQQQRVGVARALGADPPVLLMDEPFGAIDPITRTRLQEEFKRLQSELNKTVVFVTHDIDEAVQLGDRVALLREGGELVQYDTPSAILGQPASPFVEGFLGDDRELKALAVTSIDVSTLEPAVVVARSDDAAGVAQKLDARGARVAVVLGEPNDDAAVGWVARSDLGGGTLSDSVRPGIATVPLSASVKDALAAALGQPEGWIAVTADGSAAPPEFLGIFTPGSLRGAGRGRPAPLGDDTGRVRDHGGQRHDD